MRFLTALAGLGLILTLLGLTACSRHDSRARKAAREGILLVGNGTEPKSLDPHIASGVTEHHLIITLLEGLTSDHPVEESVVPAAAARWHLAAL